MSDNIINILTELVTIIIAGGGVGAFLGIGNKKKNKKLIENVAQEINKKQNERLDNIEITLDEVSSFLKDSHFLKKLNTDTQTAMNVIFDLKKCENTEISQAIFLGQTKFCRFAENILYQNFQVDNKTIKSTAYHLLKSISGRVIIENLQLKEPEIFLEHLQNYLLIQIDNFIYKFQNYKNKNNGDRRKDFKEALMEMFENIVQTTIDDYKNEKSKTT